MTCGIYSITNRVNGKKYIGQSINVEDRYKSHLAELRRGAHANDYLTNAFNKYGEDSFEFKLIKACKRKYLDRFEKLYISIYNTMDRSYGYNLISGGNAYKIYSKETRKKISESIKRFARENPEIIKKWADVRRGVKRGPKSLEEIINQSKSINTLGIFRVSKHYESCIDLKRGFRWRYTVNVNDEHVEIQSVNLYDLKMKVINKGYEWIEFTKKATDLVGEERKTYNPYSNMPNTSGYFRVSKEYNKKYKRGFIWVYQYKENGKPKKISSINIRKLESRVKEKGLIWYEIGNEISCNSNVESNQIQSTLI